MPAPIHILQQMGGVALLSLFIALIPAAMGIAYAIRPTEGRLALIRPLSLASLFAALGGCMAGLINGLTWAGSRGESLASVAALAGIAESLVPLFVSFSALTVTWLLVALGMRRRTA